MRAREFIVSIPKQRLASDVDQKELYKSVGSAIRRVRTAQHMTQETLAKSVGLTRTSLTNIEQGRQKLLVHTLAEIASKLDVALEDLFPRELQKNVPKDLKFSDDVSKEVRTWVEKTLSIKK